MKYRYNELTKRLLKEGYTAEHYPDYVTHYRAGKRIWIIFMADFPISHGGSTNRLFERPAACRYRAGMS